MWLPYLGAVNQTQVLWKTDSWQYILLASRQSLQPLVLENNKNYVNIDEYYWFSGLPHSNIFNETLPNIDISYIFKICSIWFPWVNCGIDLLVFHRSLTRHVYTFLKGKHHRTYLSWIILKISYIRMKIYGSWIWLFFFFQFSFNRSQF